MDSALAWVGQIAEWIGRFIPRLSIIKATHGGVKFVRGWKVRQLDAGMHIWWPLTTELISYPIVRQADDLRAQTLTTRDQVCIATSALIVFEVSDIKTLLSTTYDPDTTIQEIALTAVLDTLTELTWDEIRDAPRRRLDIQLRSSARAALKPYGVSVIKMTLVDLSPCRVFRVLGDIPSVSAYQQ
jgi:hypothetical protein